MRLRRWAPLARAAVFGALSLARLDALLLRLAARRGATLVLCVHSVSPAPHPFWPPTPPAVLDSLLAFLAKRARIRGLRDTRGTDPRRPEIVLSFDDGFHDFVEHAMPLLLKHGVRANMNVIPECVETGRPAWNMRVLDFLRAAPWDLVRELRVPGLATPESGSGEAKARFAAELGLLLNHRSRAERESLCGALDELMGRADFPFTRMMRREDVIEAAKYHDIGAHSWAHESMAFESDEYLRRDVDRCRDYFRDVLGLPLDTYAFPNGSYRPSQLDVLAAKGIRHSLLVDERVAREPTAVYPRINIASVTRGEARLRAAGLRARSS